VRGAEIRAEEREIISRELAAGRSYRCIGRLLKRDHTVVSREVARNGGRAAYRAIPAQRQAGDNRARPKQRLLETNTALHDAVNSGLEQKWSPRQISERLRQEFPGEDTMRVSPETIYQCLYLQARGELRTQLKLALRQGRTRRVSRSRATVARGKIPDMVNVSERPAEAEDRAVPGFWEGDLIIGKGGKSQIATLVERSSRYVMLVRIPYDRTAERVAALLAKKMEALSRLPPEQCHLGPRKREGRARELHHQDRNRCLLLRSTLALAARDQREHQRAAAAILPERNRPVSLLAGRTRRGRRRA